MNLLDKIKQNDLENEYDNPELDDSADVKERKQVDKKTIALSCVAIAIALLCGGAIAYNVHKSSVNDDTIIGLLDSEDGQDAVTNAFLSAINDYINGDITEEEFKQTIANLINDYLVATNGFTDQQIEALNTIISDYLDSTTVYTDIEKNKQSIDAIKELINDKYETNYNYVREIESQLSKLIESNTIKDDIRYEELKATDEQLKKWIEDAKNGLNNEANNTHNEIVAVNTTLTQILTDLTKLFVNTIGGTKWESGVAYGYGSYVFDKEYMYVSLVNGNTAPLTDTSAWQKTDIKTLIEKMDDKFMTVIGVSEYNDSITYNKGDYAIDENGAFYVSIINKNTGHELSDKSAWKQTDIETIIKEIKTTVQDDINSVIGADVYDNSSSYKEGDYVIYQGDLYISNVNNNTYPISDETGWTKSDINTIINELTKDSEETTRDLYEQLKEIIIKQGSDYKEVTDALKKEIEDNKLLSDEQQDALKALIDSNQDKSEEGMKKLTDDMNYIIEEAVKEQNAAREELANKVSELKDKSAADAQALKDEIDANKALSDKEKEEMKNLIDKNAKDSKDDMSNLSDSLNDIINKNKEEAVAAEKTLTEQIEALKDSTLADLEALEKKINDRFDALEIKQSSDLQEVKENLTGIIDANEKLSEDERVKLKELINNYAEENATHLDELETSLSDTIAANKADADAARDTLQSYIDSVKADGIADKQALKAEIDANKALSDAEKEEMKSLIDANKDESEQGISNLSDALTKIIEKNKADAEAEYTSLINTINALENATATDIDNLRRDLTSDIDALRVQQSSDLTEIQESLIKAIDDEKKFTAEEREAMKDAITKCADDSQASLEQLDKDLSTIIENNASLDAAEREKIQNSVSALKDATASDIDALKTNLDAKIAELDNKIKIYNTEINNKIDQNESKTNDAISQLQNMATWSKTVTYDSQAYVTYYNGSVQRFYHSLADNNIGHEPGVSGSESWWEEVDTLSLIKDIQEQVTDNKNHLLDINGSSEEFQYGVSNGQRGYYVNGQFKPF